MITIPRIAPRHGVLAAGALLAACGVAIADDWTVTNLTPAGRRMVEATQL